MKITLLFLKKKKSIPFLGLPSCKESWVQNQKLTQESDLCTLSGNSNFRSNDNQSSDMWSLLHQKVSRQNDKMKLIALKAMLLLFLSVVFFYLRGGYSEETPPLPICDSGCMICKPLYLWLWERACIPFSFPLQVITRNSFET